MDWDEAVPARLAARMGIAPPGKRIRALIDQKVAGGDLTAVEEGRPRAKVVDLMEALKASLAEKGKKERPPERRRAPALRKAG